MYRCWGTASTSATACDSGVPSESFDFYAFNIGDYYGAVEEKVGSETLSKVLYPNDGTDEGRRLRLKQRTSS